MPITSSMKVHRDLEGLPDVRALLRLAQVEPGAAGDDLALELDVFLQHLLQGEHTGHAAHQGQHDHAEGDLHLGEGEKLVENHLRIGVLFQIDDHPHPFPGGVIHHIVDALDPLFIRQLDDGFHQVELVYLIRDLGDHDPIPAVSMFLDIRPCADDHPAAAGGVGRPDAGVAHDDAAGGEVRPLDAIHNLRQAPHRDDR